MQAKDIVTAATQVVTAKFKYDRAYIMNKGHKETKKVIPGQTYYINGKELVAGEKYRERMKIGFALAWAEAKETRAAALAKTAGEPVRIRLGGEYRYKSIQYKKTWAEECRNFSRTNQEDFHFKNDYATTRKDDKIRYIQKYITLEPGKVYLLSIANERKYCYLQAGEVMYGKLEEALAFADSFAT